MKRPSPRLSSLFQKCPLSECAGGAFPSRNSPRSISQLRFLTQGSVRRAPRNEHMLSPPLYRSPQSSIKVYLKTLPAASTSMSTWPLAPTSAPVPPVTFFRSSFLFFRGQNRQGGEERRKKEKRSESRERGRVAAGERSRRKKTKKKTQALKPERSLPADFAAAILAPSPSLSALSQLSLSSLPLFSRTHRKHERLRPRDAAARRVCLNARHLEGVPGRQSPFKGRHGGVGGVAAGQRGLERRNNS